VVPSLYLPQGFKANINPNRSAMSTFTHQDKFYPSFVGRAARALFIQDMRGNLGAHGTPYREYL
jgi:hypothetical protein